MIKKQTPQGMKQTPQGMKQRVGKLIEQYICNKYSLEFNKRQQTKGYYDAYNRTNVFEIKSIKQIKKQNNRVTIFLKNHKELLYAKNGKYIFVNYELINKDRDLQLIQDIKILEEIIITVEEMDTLLSYHGIPYNRNFKGHIKEYERLKYGYIKEKYG